MKTDGEEREKEEDNSKGAKVKVQKAPLGQLKGPNLDSFSTLYRGWEDRKLGLASRMILQLPKYSQY